MAIPHATATPTDLTAAYAVVFHITCAEAEEPDQAHLSMNDGISCRLPSFTSEFTASTPLTRIRDIAHRSDIPHDLKQEIKHTIQVCPLRCCWALLHHARVMLAVLARHMYLLSMVAWRTRRCSRSATLWRTHLHRVASAPLASAVSVGVTNIIRTPTA